MDEEALFHRALSADEIAAVSKGVKDLTDKQRAGLVLHLDFEKGKVRDRSGGGNNGQLDAKAGATEKGPHGAAMVFKPSKRPAAAKGRKPRGSRSGVAFRWTKDCPIMVRAMTLADKTLFIAGPEDLLDEDAAFKAFPALEARKQIADQQAALAGERGALLKAVSAETGEELAEYKLASPPVFDGMIAAGGRLYVVTTDGKLTCYSAK